MAYQPNRKACIAAHIKGISGVPPQLARTDHKVFRSLDSLIMEPAVNSHLELGRLISCVGRKVSFHSRYFTLGCGNLTWIVFSYFVLKVIALALPCGFQHCQAADFVIGFHLFLNSWVRGCKGLKFGILEHSAVHILTGSEGGATGHNLTDIPLFLL